MLSNISSLKKEELLNLARTLFIFDQPALWDGKTEEEIDSDTDLSSVEVNVSEEQEAVSKKIFFDCYVKNDSLALNNIVFGKVGDTITYESVLSWDSVFIDKIRELPLFKQNSGPSRIAIAKYIIENYNDIYYDKTCKAEVDDEDEFALDSEPPETSKVFLYFLINAFFEANCFTEKRAELLKLFCKIKKIDVRYFDEIIQQVIIIHKAKQELINIVLE